jgi:hypothetical protein
MLIKSSPSMIESWEQYKRDNEVLDIALDLSRGFD